MSRIYKILSRDEWAAAQARGVFEGSAIDVADGYIHFSAADQAGETLTKHFAGRGDLVLAAVEADSLGAALKWEPSRGGALFPHLYGSLPVGKVVEVTPIPLDASGAPSLAGIAL